MRTLLLIAPLALLAACNNNAETTTETANADAAGAAATATPEPAMTVVADAETAIDWTGTYTGTDATGATVSLTLNRGDTYTWTATPANPSQGAASSTNGSFTWYRDNSRILLDDAGGNAIYAVGNGVVFKMPNADAPTTGTMDRATALIRTVSPAAAAPAAPAPAQ